MKNISRRDFLKLGMVGLTGLAMRPWLKWQNMLEDWSGAEKLGRNCVGGMINMRSKPSADAPIVKTLYEDTVVVWLREVVGEVPAGVYSRRWVETPEGFLFAPSVQPVYNLPNVPLDTLPETSLGRGMWVEVTIPHVDIFLATTAAAAPWLQEVPRPRLYYGQVMWVADIATNSEGQVLYRVKEHYGTYGDEFWAQAEAFRPITAEEIAPINPDVEEKKIVVDLNHQTMSCFEGKNEVYFCLISSGAKFDAQGNVVDNWATPVGPHPIWRKLVSLHMSGGASGGGWDTPGIAWTTLFAAGGVAIHSTFWHNAFGMAKSHGCVNATMEDAKWVFRWTQPVVTYDPGDLTVEMPGGTIVDVVGI